MRYAPYLIAFRTTSMETQQEVISWLRERSAVHVLDDVWFLESDHLMAGDIAEDIKSHRQIDGPLVVLKLNAATDWSLEGTSEQVVSWVRANLGS